MIVATEYNKLLGGDGGKGTGGGARATRRHGNTPRWDVIHVLLNALLATMTARGGQQAGGAFCFYAACENPSR